MLCITNNTFNKRLSNLQDKNMKHDFLIDARAVSIWDRSKRDVLKFLHYYYKQGIWMNQIFPFYAEVCGYLIFCELFYTETISGKDHSVL